MASIKTSELSSVASTITDIFTKPARSTATSSVNPTQHTRNRATRKPVVPPKPRKKLLAKVSTPATPCPPLSIPTPEESVDTDEVGMLLDEEVERPESEASLPLSTPGPESSISQTQRAQRERTSWIHKHCYSKIYNSIDYWVCNQCGKRYFVSGGTKAMAGHLTKRQRLHPKLDSVAQRRDKNGTAMHAAVLRYGEITQEGKKEQKARQRKEILAQEIDKATLEYLYIHWTITQNISINQVTHQPFRAFLEFINPAANQLLPRSPETITQHAWALREEGKQRLRHILASAISDIHITCDMWSSPNHLGLLPVVAHFTSWKLQLQNVTLALVEIEGKYSGSNQSSAVLKVLDDFGIRSKLGYFMMDNVNANEDLVLHVASVLTADGIQYNPQHRRLRCNGHVINLVVQAFLFGEKVSDYDTDPEEYTIPSDNELAHLRRLGSLGKLHKICC